MTLQEWNAIGGPMLLEGVGRLMMFFFIGSVIWGCFEDKIWRVASTMLLTATLGVGSMFLSAYTSLPAEEWAEREAQGPAQEAIGMMWHEYPNAVNFMIVAILGLAALAGLAFILLQSGAPEWVVVVIVVGLVFGVVFMSQQEAEALPVPMEAEKPLVEHVT